jgi:hypothetical protein
MAVCVITENPRGSREVYDQVIQKLRDSGEYPPPGAIFQVAGEGERGWYVVSVWDSREAFERFVEERLRPAFEALGVQREGMTTTVFDAHGYTVAQPSGAGQSA